MARSCRALQGPDHRRDLGGARTLSDADRDAGDLQFDPGDAGSRRRAGRDRCASAASGSGVGSATRAGTKLIAVGTCAASSARRASRRQPKTCCGVSPWRRATTVTTAPARSVSSRTAALASADQTRRPPEPLMTSSASVQTYAQFQPRADPHAPKQWLSASKLVTPTEKADRDSAY